MAYINDIFALVLIINVVFCCPSKEITLKDVNIIKNY